MERMYSDLLTPLSLATHWSKSQDCPLQDIDDKIQEVIRVSAWRRESRLPAGLSQWVKSHKYQLPNQINRVSFVPTENSTGIHIPGILLMVFDG